MHRFAKRSTATGCRRFSMGRQLPAGKMDFHQHDQAVHNSSNIDQARAAKNEPEALAREWTYGRSLTLRVRICRPVRFL